MIHINAHLHAKPILNLIHSLTHLEQAPLFLYALIVLL